jgi:hypothetical protein
VSAAIREAFTMWRECRAEYEGELWRRYAIAETATNGALLNALGRARDVEPVSLFMGPERRALKYASEELIEHWMKHPRMPFVEFERQWLAQREAELMFA